MKATTSAKISGVHYHARRVYRWVQVGSRVETRRLQAPGDRQNVCLTNVANASDSQTATPQPHLVVAFEREVHARGDVLRAVHGADAAAAQALQELEVVHAPAKLLQLLQRFALRLERRTERGARTMMIMFFLAVGRGIVIPGGE